MNTNRTFLCFSLLFWSAVILALLAGPSVAFAADRHDIIDSAQGKMVKIYGAGGVKRVEEYQSGFFISADGLILTAFTPALDTEDLRCVLSDGAHFDAKLQCVDPVLELALLKIDRADTPFWDLNEAAKALKDQNLRGTRILVISNLFGIAIGNEANSVQAGLLAGDISLEAKQGAFPSRYKGKAYALDVITSNPGEAGGVVLSETTGQLLGVVGKELQHARTKAWLNFAIPVDVVAKSVTNMLQGVTPTEESYKEERKKPQKAVTLEMLGLALVPELFEKTPPYLDRVTPDSPAAKADLQPDDMVLYVNGKLVHSVADVLTELEYADVADPVKLTVLRQEEILEKELKVR